MVGSLICKVVVVAEGEGLFQGFVSGLVVLMA